MIRVAICDDHFVVREGLRAILASEQRIVLVGEAGSCADVVELAAKNPIDVLVLDISLPDRSGVQCISAVHKASPSTRVLMLSVHDEAEYAEAAFSAGAIGYALKDDPEGDLLTAILTVADGIRYTTERVGQALQRRNAALPTARSDAVLTERELSVVRLLAVGNTNAEVAAALFLSVRTVETHRARALRKLGLRSRSDLVRFVRQSAPYR